MIGRLLIIFFVLNSLIESRIQIRNKDTEIIFNSDSGRIVKLYYLKKNFLRSEGYFYIYDREDDSISDIGEIIRKEKDSFLWESNDGKFQVNNQFEIRRDLILWDLSIKNISDKDRRIEFTIKFPLIEKRWKFFDGRYEHNGIEGIVKRDDINSTFPLSCVYDNISGIGIGITPEQLLSYLSSKFDNKNNFEYSTRFFLKRGQQQNVRFIIFGCESEFGWKNFIQIYYDNFPEFFIHNKEIDKRIVEGIDTLGFPYGYFYTGFSPEILRRINATTCWAYGPWKREGDWYCSEEYWDYEPQNQEIAKRYIQWQKKADEYRKYREELFKRVKDYDIAGCFYIWNGCESQLADEKFSDSKITTTPSIMSYRYETAYWMFPYGGEFGQFFEQGLKRIFSEIDGVTGIAYDSSGGMGNRKYYGKLVDKLDLPKAWDEKGIYILEGVGLAKNFDFIHSLRTKDSKYRVGIWINPGGEHPIPYMVTFRSDRGMIEWKWINTYDKKTKELLDIYRLLMGKKVLGMHHTLRGDRFGEIIPWEKFKKEELFETYRGLWKHMIIACLYYGILPYPDLIRGIPEMFEILPLLIEIKDAGWEPLTGCKESSELLISRFGKDVKYFTFANSTKDKIKTKIYIKSKYFGGYTPILSDWFGNEYEFEFTNHDGTFDLEVLPRQYYIFTSFASYKGDGVKIKTKQIKRQDYIKVNIEFLKVYGNKNEFLIFEPENYKLSEIKINEENINFSDLKFNIKLKTGDNLTIIFTSNLMKSKEEDILNFPYEKSEIFVDDDLKIYAYKIVEYFKFWFKYGSKESKEILLPVKLKNEQLTKDYKIIIEKNEIPQIKIEYNTLKITGNKDNMSEIINRLLKLLDKKYIYYGKFHVADKLWYYWDEPRNEIPKTVEMLKYMGIYDSIFKLNE